MKKSLSKLIAESIAEQSPAKSNRLVTEVHYDLSENLQNITGREAGPNFHSWAVWGSKKAGVTIRQEDLDDALKNATMVSGITGAIVGLVAAALVTWFYINAEGFFFFVLILFGGIIGCVAGALTGRAIARYSRKEAARLILEGNQTVLEDIGNKTAQFVEFFKAANRSPEESGKFYAAFRNGNTSDGGQNLLREAFQSYEKAALAADTQEKREWCCFGNCLAILHEHIRLQPYISKSLPFIIRRCVTQRMMSFDVGEVSLSVAKEFSDADKNRQPVELTNEQKKLLLQLMKKELPTANVSDEIFFDRTKSYAADNWTQIEQRMRYVWELFKRFHLEPQVRSKPFK
jgi:hypothetical protein